jgi:hypothetical protein
MPVVPALRRPGAGRGRAPTLPRLDWAIRLLFRRPIMMAAAETASFTEPGVVLERERWADLARRLWSRPYRRATAWAIPAVLLAYGFAVVNFTLAGDDWFAVFPEATLDTHFALVAGRWLMPVVWAVTGNGVFVPFFSFVLALALLSLAGLIAAGAWRLTRSWAVFAVVTLFVVNPLFTDALNTKPAHLSLSLAVVCAALAAWVLLRWQGARLWRIAIAAGLLLLALASYQPTALVLVVVAGGGEVIALGWGERPYRRAAWRRWLELLVTGVAAVAAYVLSVRISWWVTGTDPAATTSAYSLTGGYPSTLREIGGTVRDGLRVVGDFWSGGTTLYPVALKVVSLGLVLGGVLAAMLGIGRGLRGAVRRSVGIWAWLWLLGGGSLLLPFAMLFLREHPPMRGSVFTTVGLVVGFWAGLLLERVAAEKPGGRRRAAAAAGMALVLVAVLGCAHQINQGYFGLYLSNQRDLANANRMLSVMEQMPQFSRGERIRVELAGLVRFRAPAAPFSSVAPGAGLSIVNCSGLSCQTRLVNMLNLIGGGRRSFVAASVPDAPDVQAVIDAMPSWPEPGSIRFLEGVFVVKGG